MFVVMVVSVVMFFLTLVSGCCVRSHDNFTVLTVDLRAQTRPEGGVVNRLLPTNRGVVMNFESFLLSGGFLVPGFAIVAVQHRIRVCIGNAGIRRRV